MTERPLEHTRLTTNILIQEAITEALRRAERAKAVELEEGGKPKGGQGGGRASDAGSKAQGARGSVEGGRGGDGGGV